MIPILPYILLADGTHYYFTEPNPSDINIESIASALSKLCRFTGHTRKFYSVAQHSVLVSQLVPEDLALIGLLHDAHEAFVGDIATPFKQLLPSYQVYEVKAARAVAERFGLLMPFPPEVKHADLAALATEKRDLMIGDNLDWPTLKDHVPSPIHIIPWSPARAQEEFMRRYLEITT